MPIKKKNTLVRRSQNEYEVKPYLLKFYSSPYERLEKIKIIDNMA